MATNQGFVGVRVPHSVPSRSFGTSADDRKPEYRDGPIRIGIGGHIAMVEVAHSKKVDFYKKLLYNIYIK